MSQRVEEPRVSSTIGDSDMSLPAVDIRERPEAVLGFANNNHFKKKSADSCQSQPLDTGVETTISEKNGNDPSNEEHKRILHMQENPLPNRITAADESAVNGKNPENSVENLAALELKSSLSISNVHAAKDVAQETTVLDINANSTFNKTDMLRMRTHLLEVIEELKMRRVGDKENEEKMKRLMEKNHKLNIKYEDCLEQITSIRESKDVSLATLKNDHKTEMKNMELIQQKLQITIASYVKECKFLKDEVQCIQMNKYNMEKQLKEQERRLKLRDSVRETSIKQLTTLENKCREVIQRMEELVESQNRLETNVKQACKLNNQLSNQIEHHDSEIKSLKSQVSTLQDSLTKANLKLVQQTHQTVEELREKEIINQKLRHQLQAAETSNQALQKHYQQSKHQLQVSSDLISKQVKQISHEKEEIHNLQMKLTELTDNHAKLRRAFEEKKQELETELNNHKETEQEWIRQKKSVEFKLTQLQNDYESLGNAHCSLEELNTKWAMKNTALTQEVKSLKEKLCKPKNSRETQINAETVAVMIQTERVHTQSKYIQSDICDDSGTAIQTESIIERSLDKRSNESPTSTNKNHADITSYEADIRTEHSGKVIEQVHESNVTCVPESQQVSMHSEQGLSIYRTFTSTLAALAAVCTPNTVTEGKQQGENIGELAAKRKKLEVKTSRTEKKHLSEDENNYIVEDINIKSLETNKLSHSPVRQLSGIILAANRTPRREKHVSFSKQLEHRSDY